MGIGGSTCKILIRRAGKERSEGTLHSYEDTIKLILKEWDVIVWTGLKWLRIGFTVMSTVLTLRASEGKGEIS
jgi:hypothetical protein